MRLLHNSVNLQTISPDVSKGITFRNSTIEGNFGSLDVYVDGSDHFVIDDVYIESTGNTTGVELKKCIGVIKNSRISSDPGNTGKAIFVNTNSEISIDGNTLDTDYNGGGILVNTDSKVYLGRNVGTRLLLDSSSTLIGGGLTPIAWVRWGGSTGNIYAAENINSVTRNSVGNYTVHFVKAMANTNYAVITNAENGAFISTMQAFPGAITSTDHFTVFTANPSGVLADGRQISAVVYGQQ